MPRPALFLDRDGVLNIGRDFVAHPRDFFWAAGAKECVRRFNDMGYWVFVVTNQTGIGFGLYTEADMQAVHQHMVTELAAAGGRIDKIYFCPFHPEAPVIHYRSNTLDRKPGPGMILKAMQEHEVDPARSFLIGDKRTDMAAAEAAGLTGFLFNSAQGANLDLFAQEALRAMA